MRIYRSDPFSFPEFALVNGQTIHLVARWGRQQRTPAEPPVGGRCTSGVPTVGGGEHDDMTVAEPQAAVPEPSIRWYRPTPGGVLVGLLLVEVLLFLSEYSRWLPWHKGYAVLTTLAVVVAAMALVLFWYAVALLFGLRFQYSVRSLLLLVVVVALPCSWLASERQNAREQMEAMEAIKSIGGEVRYDYDFGPDFGQEAAAEPPSASWLLDLVGTDFLYTFVAVDLVGPEHGDDDIIHIQGQSQLQWLNLSQTKVSDHGLASLGRLKDLRILSLSYTQVTDASLVYVAEMNKLEALSLRDTNISSKGLKHLAKLTRLKSLDLACPQVSDAGLLHLEGLSQLESLLLDDSTITDTGLEHIGKMAKLEALRLGSTQISDIGLEHLNGLRHLYWLYLRDTKVTVEGVKRLQQALPNCEIEWDPPTPDK